ncbi:hypothetical protein TUSST3_76450 [Streptomyces sp. TUS-ST3]|uniref:hypothetical protein n=1 Tax=Streptomyces sp. TUS-ST3 TaxID=3025591 RepID=UPI00235B4D09|nr:hypothetical protein [Streptomyces sp. TUS-ST3]GLP71025.1 hypothetical protein TUSST3_76450 [Streptomyces sp. TUS-ST3]
MRLTRKDVKCRIDLQLEDASAADVQALVQDAEEFDHAYEITQRPGGSFAVWAEFGDDLTGARKMIAAVEKLATEDSD